MDFAEEGGVLVARDSFLFRTDPKILNALRKWAEDELRSANGQLDYILRKALKEAGRLNAIDSSSIDGTAPDTPTESA